MTSILIPYFIAGMALMLGFQLISLGFMAFQSKNYFDNYSILDLQSIEVKGGDDTIAAYDGWNLKKMPLRYHRVVGRRSVKKLDHVG